MRTSIRRVGVSVGLSGLIMVGAGAAYASATNVSVNGSTASGAVAYNASKHSSAIVFMTNFGVDVRCSTAAVTGYILRGTSVIVANPIGTISTLSLTGCAMGPSSVNVAMTGGYIEVRNTPTNAGDPVDVTIKDVHATFAGGGCSFDADGEINATLVPGAGNPDATLTLESAAIGANPSLDTGFDLDISNVVGCAGEVLNGDELGAWDSNTVTGAPSSFRIDTLRTGAGPVTHS